jgi:hypothetical protein
MMSQPSDTHDQTDEHSVHISSADPKSTAHRRVPNTSNLIVTIIIINLFLMQPSA